MKDLSDVPYLLQNLGKAVNVPANIYPLTVSFRNPKRVLHIAGLLNEFRRFVLGGKQDATEATTFVNASLNANNVGRVRYIRTDKLSQLSDEMNTSREDVAIITTQEHREAAKAKYRNQQVFTTEEIGGLEYDNIIIDDAFFDNEMLATLYEPIEKYKPGMHVNTNKSKEPSEHLNVHHFLNALNTALTRPRKHLYFVCTTSKSRARKFYELLQLFIENANATHPEEDKDNVDYKKSSTKEDWHERVRKLVASGKISHAKDVWMNELKLTLNAFNERFDTTVTMKTTQSVRLNDENIPTSNQLKKLLNASDWNQRFLNSLNDQPCLLVRLLVNDKGIGYVNQITEPHYKKKLTQLLLALIKSEMVFDTEVTGSERAFFWMIANQNRANILNKFAGENKPLMDICLSEIDRYIKSHGPMVLSELTHTMMPLYLLIGQNAYLIFHALIEQNEISVKTDLAEWWSFRISPQRTFIGHCADNAGLRQLSIKKLSDISLEPDDFLNADASLDIETIDALIVSKEGVNILYRSLYQKSGPQTRLKLFSDEFMLEVIPDLNTGINDTRLGFLLKHINEANNWPRNYLIDHNDFNQFMKKTITIDMKTISLFSYLFRNPAFYDMLIIHFSFLPHTVKLMFKDIDFNITLDNGKNLIVTLASSTTGIKLLQILLLELKEDLFPLDHLDRLVKAMLERQLNYGLISTPLSELALTDPSTLGILIDTYPSFVKFIEPEDLTKEIYGDGDGDDLNLIALLLSAYIESDNTMLLSAFVAACDFHLLRTVAFHAWFDGGIAETLCQQTLGSKCLLKLIELTDARTITDYADKNAETLENLRTTPFGAYVLEKIQQKKIIKKTPLREIREFLDAITLDNIKQSDVKTFHSFMTRGAEYYTALSIIIAGNKEHSIDNKMLALLTFSDLHNVIIENTKGISLYYHLMINEETRQILIACFKKFGHRWITLNDTHFSVLFDVYSDNPPVTTPFYQILTGKNGVALLTKLFLGMKLSNAVQQRFIDIITMKLESKSFHDYRWNMLSMIATNAAYRQCFLAIIENNPELLEKIPLAAWDAPLTPRDEPAQPSNGVTLKLLYRSPEGAAFFRSQAEGYCPQLHELVSTPTPLRFESIEESEIKIAKLGFNQLNSKYVAKKDEIDLIKQIIDNSVVSKLDDLMTNVNFISLLNMNHVNVHTYESMPVIFHLMLNDKLNYFIGNNLSVNPEFMNILFSQFDPERRVTFKMVTCSLQQFLFSSSKTLALLEFFIQIFPGKLNALPMIKQSFKIPNSLASPKSPGEFIANIRQLHPSALNLFAEEFPTLKLNGLTHIPSTMFSKAKSKGAEPTHNNRSNRKK